MTTTMVEVSVNSIEIEHGDASLLNRSQLWEIRAATHEGRAIAVLQYRQSSRHDLLWATTLQYLPCILATKHRGLVEVLGVARHDDGRPAMLVMERCDTSLYDLLHVHRTTLSDSAIVHIALEILAVLEHCQGEGLDHLTSRKVLFNAAGNVIIIGIFQRDILKHARVPIASSIYEAPAHHEAEQPPPPEAAQVYTFGVLLWEMCCGELPTVELFHRFAQVTMRHPRCEFESLVRQCVHEDPNNRPTLPELRETLVKLQLAAPRLGDVLDGIKSRFQEQLSPAAPTDDSSNPVSSSVVAKRLEAVEAQLLEEQRHFDIVVGQLEFANSEIAALQLKVGTKEMERKVMEEKLVEAMTHSAELDAQRKEALDEREQWQQQSQVVEKQLQRLEILYNEQMDAKERSKTYYTTIVHEMETMRQERGLLEARLDDAKAQLVDEKARSEELGIRWEQTIKLVEDERRLREKAERHLTDMRQQNQILQDQVKEWHPETGATTLEIRRTYEAQLQDKDEHIQRLHLEMVAFREEMNAMESTVESYKAELNAKETSLTLLKQSYDATRSELQLSQATCLQQRRELERCESQLEVCSRALTTTQVELKATEDLLKAEIKKREDQELALKSRRCLDFTCDAPPFLIQASGYCKDCDEKRANQEAARRRELEKERANHPPDQVVRDAYAAGGIGALLDTIEKFHMYMDIVLVGLKKLQLLCETPGPVKDSLGDFNAFQRLVALMAQYPDDAAMQLASTRLIGVLAFNHDVNRVRLVCDGALNVILGGMCRLAADKIIQQSSCTALTNLAHNCEINRRKILELSGIERVLDAMQAFPHDMAIQQGCAWALISLAASDFMCEQIASRGGVGGLVAAMLNCPGDVGVQYYASWALLNLVSGIQAVQSFAKQEGAVEVCEAALACFTDHDGIQDKAGSVVAILTGQVEEDEDVQDI
ncbi:hypothetical protein AeMF1_014396, partial [Aphanomyces euteiches]